MSNAAAPGDATGRIFPTSQALTADMGWRQPFTAAQWRELEHQALIYKYLIAGVPVPPDLLLPIQRSFEAVPPRNYHHYPSLSYFSYYGKKLDPEPGRCRRTDGKKWRCTKDAHPDSKYCERHMHRSRNRSRKHVESKTNITQQQSQTHFSSSSTTATHVASGSGGSFQCIALQSAVGDVSKPQGVCSSTFGSSPLQSKLLPCKGYLHEAKTNVDEQSLFSKYPGSIQEGLRMNSSIDNSWGLMPSQVPLFPASKAKTGLLYDCFPSQLDAMQDIAEVTSRSSNLQEHQHSNFRSEFGLAELGKQDCQGLRPFFSEWPKARESWLDMDDEQSEHNSFSATRLSISIPMASSNISTTTCCSPNDD